MTQSNLGKGQRNVQFQPPQSMNGKTTRTACAERGLVPWPCATATTPHCAGRLHVLSLQAQPLPPPLLGTTGQGQAIIIAKEESRFSIPFPSRSVVTAGAEIKNLVGSQTAWHDRSRPGNSANEQSRFSIPFPSRNVCTVGAEIKNLAGSQS